MKSSIYDYGYALLLVCDPRNLDVEVPEVDGEQPVYRTASCIIISTDVPGHDEVQVILAHKDENVDQAGLTFVYSGKLKTPTKNISIHDPDEKFMLEETVTSIDTIVSIFTNHPTFPTKVLVKYS